MIAATCFPVGAEKVLLSGFFLKEKIVEFLFLLAMPSLLVSIC